jgi:hypothetical protein
MSDPASRRLRRLLTGLWIASILGVLIAAVYMTAVGGIDVPEVREHTRYSDYLLPTGLSFMSQYVDATLGMGYGTTLTALLVMLGFPVRQVVLAVLLQQLAAGGIGSLGHHLFGNADLRPGHFHFRLAVVLGVVAIGGSFVAATAAASMAEQSVDVILGIVIVAMGLILFGARYVHLEFSWWRAALLGLIAGANKGFMGGGYGPLIVAGQVISGDTMRHAVAVTALSEALSCVGGIAGYLILGIEIPWMLTAALVVGGLVSSLLAAATIRSLPEGALKSVIASVYIFLGSLTLWASLT